MYPRSKRGLLSRLLKPLLSRRLVLMLLSAIVLLITPGIDAYAAWSPSEWFAGEIYDQVGKIFVSILSFVFSWTGVIISAMVKILTLVITFKVDADVIVVKESWKIMRNFANMFFILALIVMAFATIFDLESFGGKLSGYDVRKLFVKFLVAALLINFSLVIGGIIIDSVQVLNNVFLTAIGNAGDRLGQNLNPAYLLPNSDTIPTTAAAFNGSSQLVLGLAISLIFSLVLIFTFLFSVSVAAIFTIIRIPIIWALLIISPIAWVCSIFPALRPQYSKWWRYFIGWNLFLPLFLFALYFGLYFLQNQGDVISKPSSEFQKPLDQGQGITFSFQLLFYYVLTAVFLIGGTLAALKASMFAGTGTLGIARWSKNRVANTLGFTAVGRAAKERYQEYLEGRQGWVERETDFFRRRFGVKNADFKQQKDFVDRASKEYGDVERKYNLGQINKDDLIANAKKYSAASAQSYANRKMLASIGQLDESTFVNTMKGLANNPYAVQDFAQAAKKGKFSALNDTAVTNAATAQGPYKFLRSPNFTVVRRELFRHIKDTPKIASKLSRDEFRAGMSIFGGSTTIESGDFMDGMAKVRPDFVVDQKIADGSTKSRQELFADYLEKGSNLGSMHIDTWSDADFQAATKTELGSKRTPKQYRAYVNSMENSIRTYDPDRNAKWNIIQNIKNAVPSPAPGPGRRGPGPGGGPGAAGPTPGPRPGPTPGPVRRPAPPLPPPPASPTVGARKPTGFRPGP